MKLDITFKAFVILNKCVVIQCYSVQSSLVAGRKASHKERIRAEAFYNVAIGPTRGIVGCSGNVIPKLLVPRFYVLGVNQIG